MGRTVKVCHWDFKVNSLWLWWYCILVLAAEGYLMYRAVLRCKDYNELPWDTQDKPVSELYVYIAFIVISIMCVPFFVITAIFKIGSYSNDGTRLGRDNVLHHLNVETPEGHGSDKSKFFKDLWRHIGPLSHTFHIVSGFVLLLPIVIIDGQKVKHGFLNPDQLWSSELDVLFGRGVYSLDSATPSPQVNVTGSNTYNTVPTRQVMEAGPVTLSPEFVNYILVLIIYSLRYAGVYWYTNASFSVVFAFIMLISTLHNVFAYCGMGVLYKFSENLHAVSSISLVLNNRAIIVLYLLATFVMFCSTLAIFNYGYCHYVESCRKFLKVHFPTYARYVAKMPVGCHGYIPHLLATVCLVLYVALRAPIVYDYVSVYRVTAFPLLLTCIVMDVLYMMTWIALWLGFTVKQTWDFRVNPQMDIVQQPQRNAITMASRTNGQVQQAEVTVIGSTRTDINRNNRQDPPGSSGPETQNNNYSSHPPVRQEVNGDALSVNSDTKSTLQNTKDQGLTNEEPQPIKPQKPEKPKLQPLIVDISQDSSDIVDTPTSPISPTSALKKSGLRKSGERRHNAPQRVTFDDSVDQIVDNEVSTINSAAQDNKHPLQQMSPTRKKKHRDNLTKRQQHPEAMKPLRGNHEHKTHTGGTPENTLTRNYRSSLRDKCGEYYKQLGDPPAAQSSPRPKNRPLSDSYEASPDEILLNPLNAGNLSNNGTINNPANHLSPVRPVNKDYFHQRAKSSDATRSAFNNQGENRLRDPKRLSGRKSNDDSKAYSYPPQLSSPPKQKVDSSNLNRGNIPPKYHTSGRPTESNTHLKPNNSYSITSSHSPNSNSTSNTSYDYYPNIMRDPNNKSYLMLSSPHEQTSGNKAKVLPPHLIRPLNINTKPELNRRDSALPSSNETSSNESAENMLCSQV